MKQFLAAWGFILAVIVGTPAAAVTQDPLPQVYSMTPTEVNMQTGYYQPSFTDLVMGHLKLVRGGAQATAGNAGIKHNLAGIFWTDTSTAQTKYNAEIDGKTISWAPVSTGGWIVWNNEALDTALTFTNNRWQLVGRDGTVYQFMPLAALGNSTSLEVLDYAEYPDGTRLTYSYNSSGLLRTIISNRGYAIVLDYTVFGSRVEPCGSNLHQRGFDFTCSNSTLAQSAVTAACAYNTTLVQVDPNTTCASAALKVTYGYTLRSDPIYGTVYDMTSVTDVRGGVTTYQHDANGQITCITFVNSPTCRITNTYSGLQISQQVMASGAVWQLAYQSDYDPDNPPLPGQIRYSYSWLTDPAGNVTTTRYENGQFDELIQPERQITSYVISGSDIVSVTYPEGNQLVLGRDGNRIWTSTQKAKPNTGLADIVVSQTYLGTGGWESTCQYNTPKVCDAPVTRVDPNGKETDYTYDTASGKLLTETAPAVPYSLNPAYTVRPQTRYTYAQRYAWILSGGSYVHAATPIWVLTQKSICKTDSYLAGSGCQNPVSGAIEPADEVITTYDYGPDSGPNNLLLRGVVEDAGAGKLNLRACYTYDGQGNKISETKPLGTGATCP